MLQEMVSFQPGAEENIGHRSIRKWASVHQENIGRLCGHWSTRNWHDNGYQSFEICIEGTKLMLRQDHIEVIEGQLTPYLNVAPDGSQDLEHGNTGNGWNGWLVAETKVGTIILQRVHPHACGRPEYIRFQSWLRGQTCWDQEKWADKVGPAEAKLAEEEAVKKATVGDAIAQPVQQPAPLPEAATPAVMPKKPTNIFQPVPQAAPLPVAASPAAVPPKVDDLGFPLLDPEAQSREKAAETPAKAPPRTYVLIADWCNFLAGLCLCTAFILGGLIFDRGVTSLSFLPSSWFVFCFNTEGVLYTIGCFFMIPIMVHIGSAFGAMQFAVLTIGGIFFSFSGLVAPGCIVSIGDAFSIDPCTAVPHVTSPKCWNAFAHFGITCFMVGTAMGQSGVMKLPKNKFVSPFWGVTFYTLGAYTIGIFKFWGPVALVGWTGTWNWWVGLLGAIYLTTGALIFGLMNGSFGIKS